jgi:hypothetical protein
MSKKAKARTVRAFAILPKISPTAAAPLVGCASTVFAPPRIAQIQSAGIGECANGCAANRANGRSSCGISGCGANCGASAGAQKAARYRPVSGVRAARRQRQRRCHHRPDYKTSHPSASLQSTR